MKNIKNIYLYTSIEDTIFLKNILKYCLLLSLDWFLLIYAILSSFILLSAVLVILVRNPIHSVLYLILVFLGVGFLLLLLKIEFLAFLFFIVYLGAIAVLFLFVVMMLNIRLTELKENIIKYLPLSTLIFVLFIIEFLYLVKSSTILNSGYNIELIYSYKTWYRIVEDLNNIEILGSLIYTYHIYAFILAGIILLLAIIGAIILTLNKALVFKRQNYSIQNRKTIENSINIIKNVRFYKNAWKFYKKTK